MRRVVRGVVMVVGCLLRWWLLEEGLCDVL